MWVLSKWDVDLPVMSEVVALFKNKPTENEIEKSVDISFSGNHSILGLFNEGFLCDEHGLEGISLQEIAVTENQPNPKEDKIDILDIEVGDKIVIENSIIGEFSSWIKYAANDYTVIMNNRLSLSGLRRDRTSNIKGGCSINKVIKK